MQLIGTAVDVTELVDSQQRLERLAHHDALTNLPNRNLFHARLTHTIQVCERLGTEACVCFIDLDNFKNINDSYGHSMGDQVLIEVGKRLFGLVREDDTLARIGGDEFVLVIENMKNDTHHAEVLNDVLSAFEVPFIVEDKSFILTASIGVSCFPEHGTSIEELCKHADTAMYQAKESGKNNIKFYSKSMSQDVITRLVMENDLKGAIQQAQFELYYQPQVCLKTKKLTGLEALIRWNHPTKGLIEPNAFIGLTEELRMIITIGNWVIGQACQDLKRLQETCNFQGKMAINVSVLQLEQSHFIDAIKETLAKYQINANKIELEITESVVISNPKYTITLLNKLRDIGFAIALDDFGTGYSSLSDLKQLPVSKLKIDKSFVDDLPDGENDKVITQPIISLSNAMNMEALAEGIETQGQMDFLIQNGCGLGQGYLFSKPLPLKHLIDWLNTQA